MKNFANNLILLRKNNNFTQDDIAEKVYVSRQAVSKWERGESIPDIETIEVLSKLYGVTIDDLIKNDLSQTENVLGTTNTTENFDELKRLHRRQTMQKMVLWGILLIGCYALLCGIIHTTFISYVNGIWIFWFTLPVVPPIIFAIRFRHEIGKKYLMFFVNVPFIAGIIYLIIMYLGNENGAWISFLIIPVYYLIAIMICVQQIKIERAAKKNKSNQ